jgi:hypothetical protein
MRMVILRASNCEIEFIRLLNKNNEVKLALMPNPTHLKQFSELMNNYFKAHLFIMNIKNNGTRTIEKNQDYNFLINNDTITISGGENE